MSQYPHPFVGTVEERQQIEAALPKQVVAKPKKARKLLVSTLNVRDGKVGGGHKAIAYGNLMIDLAGQKTGAYQAVFCNDPEIFRPAQLAQFDAICFNNTCGVLFEDAELRQSLLNFVSSGKGFVGIHAALATFVQYPVYDQFPPFGEMLGAYENGGHPWKQDETITLKVDDPASPLNAAFPKPGFPISDEVFQLTAPYTRKKLHVLLSIDTDKTDMSPNRYILPDRRKDKDLAISWVRQYGKGRVFYTSLGHNPHLFWNAAVVQHYFAGIQYALGDLATDDSPSEK